MGEAMFRISTLTVVYAFAEPGVVEMLKPVETIAASVGRALARKWQPKSGVTSASTTRPVTAVG